MSNQIEQTKSIDTVINDFEIINVPLEEHGDELKAEYQRLRSLANKVSLQGKDPPHLMYLMSTTEDKPDVTDHVKEKTIKD